MMKHVLQRALSFALAVVMVFSLFPVLEPHVHAATSTDLSALNVPNLTAAVTVDATESGTASWVASGTNAIKASLVGKYSSKSFVITYHTYAASTTTLTFTNLFPSEAVLQFDYSVSTVNGTVQLAKALKSLSGSGTYKGTIAAGGTELLKLSVTQKQGTSNTANGASIEITNLKIFLDNQNEITFEPATEGGSFMVGEETISATKKETYSATDELKLTAVPADGYSFAGWYSSEGGYLSADLTWTKNFEKAQTVTAKFIPTTDGIFKVGDALFDNLTYASQCAAGSQTKTVIPVKDVTVTGSHTIVLGSTLLIPYNDAEDCPTTDPVAEPLGNKSTHTPTVYRTLTIADGASITVEGAVSVAAKHVGAQASTSNIYGGAVFDKYGCIQLNSGADLIVANGGTLYAWGYVLGAGTVTVNNGGVVYEKMQISDYRGGSNTLSIATNKHAFPFSQYYVQNIEAKAVYNHGALLKAHAALVVSGEEAFPATIDFIGGDSSLFYVGEDATVTKTYNGTTDRLIFDTTGNVEVRSLSLNINNVPLLGSLNVNSADFELPINGNITINVNSGMATVKQNLILQPGAQVNVANNAMLTLGDPDTGTPYSVYLADSENWGNYCFSNKTHEPVGFAPGRTGNPRKTAALTDAAVDLNGFLVNMGKIYTTKAGAAVISSEGTGIIFMMADAPAATTFGQYTGGADKANVSVIPALLKNGNTETPFTETAGSVVMDMFVYDTFRDMWMKPASDLTLTYDANGGTGAPTPQTVTLEGLLMMTESHIMNISDDIPTKTNAEFLGWSLVKDGTVVAYSGQPVVIGENTTLYAKWKSTVQQYEITWVDANGDTIYTDEISSGSVPVYNVTEDTPEPSKASNATNHYTFAGWTTTNGGTTVEELTAVTQDTTYYAVFTATAHTDTTTPDHNCDACGYVMSECSDGDDANHNCDVCNKENISNHNYNSVVTAPTCTAGGYTTYTCSVCGDTYTADEVAAKGHKDENFDHVCDNGCDVYQGTHADSATDKDHVCDYGCKEVLEDCSDAAGDKDHKCDICGEPNVTEHTEGAPTTENNVDATCGTAGSYDTVVYCTECEAELSRVTTTVDALGHTAGEASKENYTAPTCGAAGSYNSVVRCTVCGEVISTERVTEAATGNHIDEDNDHNCDVCKKQDITGHSYDAVVTAPTCTEDGYTTYTCSVCGDNYVADEVAALGHTAGAVVVENNVAPDCETGGSYDNVTYCTVCGVETSRETVTVDALGHSYDAVVTAPTCTEDGYTTYTCSVCGDNYVADKVDALGHTAGAVVVENNVAPDCETGGSYDNVTYCTVCGVETSRETVTVAATGHKDDDFNHVCDNGCDVYQGEHKDSDTDDDHICDYCKNPDDVLEDCSDAADDKDHKCDICGELTDEAHTPGDEEIENEVEKSCNNNGSYDTVVYCAVCGEELSRTTTTVEAGHTAGEPGVENTVDATCDTDGSYDTVVRCTVCSSVISSETTIVPMLGHTKGDEVTENEVDPDCDTDGSYDIVVYCSVCGDELSRETTTVAKLGHTEVTTTENNKPATCTEAGSYDRVVKCSVCGDELSRETITVPELGHEEIIDEAVEATCTNTGLTEGKHCDVCGEVIRAQEVLPIVDHFYVPENGYKCKWCDEIMDVAITWSINGVEETVEVDYGTTPTHVVPDSYNEGTLTFSFSGWIPEISAATEAKTYTAQFVATGWDGMKYLELGVEKSGWAQVGDDWYYFDPANDNKAVTNIARVPYPSEAINGNTYGPAQQDLDYCNAHGIEFVDEEEGWFLFGEDGKFQSDANGIVDNAWAVNGYFPWHPGMVQVGEGEDPVYYYFLGHMEGDVALGGNVMVVGDDVYVSRNTTDRDFALGGVYTFGEDGKLCEYDGIVSVNGTLRYYDDARLMCGAGLVKVGENYIYVRYNGELVVNDSYWVPTNDMGIAEGSYQFDVKGYMIQPVLTTKDGVYAEDGGLYYYVDGKRTYAGLVHYELGTLNGVNDETYKDAWIYVKSNGQLVVGQKYWVTKTEDANHPAGYYLFNEYGILVDMKNGVYAEDGGLFYYEDNVRTYAGLINYTDGETYNNSLIYVKSNGQLATGEYYITKANTDETGYVAGKYVFDENGIMMSVKHGIVEENGALYYYENNVIQYGSGLVDVDGKYIYVRSNGHLAVGNYWVTNTNETGIVQGMYEFGTDGYMIIVSGDEGTTLTNGIVSEDGALHYYVNGVKQYGLGLISYDNSYIYVKSNGELATGRYWVTNHNDCGFTGLQTFDADGLMIIG